MHIVMIYHNNKPDSYLYDRLGLFPKEFPDVDAAKKAIKSDYSGGNNVTYHIFQQVAVVTPVIELQTSNVKEK